MTLMAKFFLGLFCAIFVFGLLMPIRIFLIDIESMGWLFLSLIVPIFIPFLAMAFKTFRKTAGFCMALIGISIITIPFGLSDVFKGLEGAVNNAPTQNITEATTKSVLQNSVSLFETGLFLFGICVGFFLILAGVLTYRSKAEHVTLEPVLWAP